MPNGVGKCKVVTSFSNSGTRFSWQFYLRTSSFENKVELFSGDIHFRHRIERKQMLK